MNDPKRIIVSNRLPVSITRVNGVLQVTPSSGGLATAMSSLGGTDQFWIGWPGISSDDLSRSERTFIVRELQALNCVPVFLTAQQVKLFYEGYANGTLWPLFHYFQSHAKYADEYWAAYQEVSILFKRAVMKHARAEDTIWIHDYHLMLLPQLVRQTLPTASIGFFLHIPFPSYEIFRLLPNRREILEGLLGADLVGFHIYDYARHFLSSVLRILGHENNHGSITFGKRTVVADAFPIGIDYQKYKVATQEPGTLRQVAALAQHYGTQRIVLSVDRLDYSKGILKRLDAFELFLRKNPKQHKQVTLVVIAVPSRTEVGSYQELRDQIEQTVSRINGMYGAVDWTPISYQFKHLPFEEVLALYIAADVALVTPLRDGMNLVAKEFVAAKQHTDGVLVLSEMAGAIDEMPEALRINPNDTTAIAGAIKEALRMPKKDRVRRLHSMQRRLAQYDVQRWGADFLEQLVRIKERQADQGNKLITAQAYDRINQEFADAKHRLVCLDYDGTLKGFVTSHDPNAAMPDRQLLRIITDLTAVPETTVCIVSGRPREALDAWFGKLPVVLAAEHGAWLKENGEWSQQQASFLDYKREVIPIMQQYVERTPGATVEEKSFAVVWHYRNVPTELAYARTSTLKHDLKTLLRDTDIGVFNGNKIIEVKPRSVHKGAVVAEFLALYPSDFVLCAGDDYTDEDMFEALPEEAYTIKVGLGETRARYQLPDVANVRALLCSLIESQ